MKLGILGLGKMGEALLRGIAQSGAKSSSKRSSGGGATDSISFQVLASTRSEASARDAGTRLKVRCLTDNRKVAEQSQVILLCVKPHQVEKVLAEIAPVLTKDHLLISICASVTNEQLSQGVGSRCAVVRAMPNTPALIGEGVTAFAPGHGVSADQRKITEKIFSSVGQVVEVEEGLMDGVTGLSGCGPAYGYMIIEALSEAGVKVGLPRKTATLLAAQTLLGASKMVMERGVHPAALKDEVTTPAGCTIDGLMALEEGALRVTLIKAVLAATKRSKSLRKKTS
jgi:pyrroline-5-carboxylate reductase